MLTGSDAATPARRQNAKTPRRKKDEVTIEGLRLIVSQYQVCYEIWPVSMTSQGVTRPAGFEVLLCGVNDHAPREEGVVHAVPYCQHCARTYDELREIAEWILRLKKPPLGSEIYSFDHALHVAPPNRQLRSEVIITAAIFLHPDHKHSRHACESDCLKEVRERLAKLGIHEDVWYAAASATP